MWPSFSSSLVSDSARQPHRGGFQAALGMIVAMLGLVSPVRGEPAFVYGPFDGQALVGWHAENGCRAEVRDGMILIAEGNGWLRSHHRYRDFVLELEWKALKPSGYDAGIYIRAEPDGAPFPKTGYQINLLQGHEGEIRGISGAEPTRLVKPAGEWNRFVVRVEGETIELTVNGRRAYRAKGLVPRWGFVGFQAEVPAGGQFLVRNVRIHEPGYETLLSGSQLEHWEGVGAPASTCWEVSDGVLRCNGKKGPWLRSRREYGDFNLRLEYRLPPGGNSGVYVRVPANGNHHRHTTVEPPAGFEVQLLDDSADQYRFRLKDYQFCASIYDIAPASPHVGRPAGQWNTLEINCLGDHVTVAHNGHVVVDASPQQFPLLSLRQRRGYLGLQNHRSVIEFRNLRIGPPMEPADFARR